MSEFAPGYQPLPPHVDLPALDHAVIERWNDAKIFQRSLDHTAGEFMTRDPKTVGADDLIDDALALFDEYKITALFVVKEDGRGKKPVGVLHIHDCPPSR